MTTTTRFNAYAHGLKTFAEVEALYDELWSQVCDTHLQIFLTRTGIGVVDTLLDKVIDFDDDGAVRQAARRARSDLAMERSHWGKRDDETVIADSQIGDYEDRLHHLSHLNDPSVADWMALIGELPDLERGLALLAFQVGVRQDLQLIAAERTPAILSILRSGELEAEDTIDALVDFTMDEAAGLIQSLGQAEREVRKLTRYTVIGALTKWDEARAALGDEISSVKCFASRAIHQARVEDACAFIEIKRVDGGGVEVLTGLHAIENHEETTSWPYNEINGQQEVCFWHGREGKHRADRRIQVQKALLAMVA